MRLLKGDGKFSISGLPWLEDGETRVLPTGALTAKCLCQKHNSALSPLDNAALRFFTVLKSGLDKGPSTNLIVSGHDVERWLLKTVKALATSKNLAKDRKRLPGVFAREIQVLEMLDDPQAWPSRAGLYCPMLTGDTAENHNRFQIQPYTNESSEIVGLHGNILGLTFVLMLQPPDFAEMPQLLSARFRPSQISIRYPTATSLIDISWDDGHPHDPLSLHFMREVDANPSLGECGEPTTLFVDGDVPDME
ncbi:hypothetical protein [Mesorhizobium sp. URHB0026]